MAWVRIDDTVPEHRKHLKAGAPACWLWVCAIAYSQRQLSDGFVPDEAINLIGVRTGAKALADKLVTVGLFDLVMGGYQVHDYHTHNASREEAQQHQAELHEKRVAAGRLGGIAKASKLAKPLARAVALALANSSPIPSHPIPSRKETEDARLSPPINGTTDQALADRAGRFCERYSELYEQHRHGARYLPRPALDFTNAIDLCRVWDDARLERLAVVFLKTDHDFAASGSRTIGQFAALASWADDRLRAVEAS